MGGDIKVTSVAGAGSCFEFNVALGINHDVRRRIPSINIDKLNILVVDDNATNREILRGQLEPWGAQILEAASGEAALQILEENFSNAGAKPIDIGIIDMQMPEMDGAQLAGILKANARFKDIKLIMMTSMAGRGDAQYFAQLGFSAYFSKPVTPSDLFDALSVLMEGGEVLTEASPLVTHHYLHSLAGGTDQVLHRQPNFAHVDNKLGDIRILLVEDNEINQCVALGILENIYLSADVAVDGVAALQALNGTQEDERYHVVLMDCQMPRMDGFQATQQIRLGKAGTINQGIPIIAMTANAMKGDREKCLESGMNDYLSKPIEPDLLQAALIKWAVPMLNEGVDPGVETLGFDESVLVSAKAESHSSVSQKEDSEPFPQNSAIESLMLWDKESTFRRIGGKEKILNKLLEMFARDMPERITMLVQAVNSEEMDQVEHLAHVIKGVAGNLGALPLQELANQLQNCKEPHIQQQLMTDIEAAYQAVSILFDEYRNGVEKEI